MIRRMALAAVAVLSLQACGRAKPPAADPALAVEGAVVKRGAIDTQLTLQGSLQPYEQVDVFPRVAGFIRQIPVDRGTRVRRGQVLVQLSAPEVLAQTAGAGAELRSAQARLAEAEARLAADSATADRLAAAAQTPGAVAENDVLVARQTVAASRARVTAASEAVAGARDALRATGQQSGYLTIRAPFDGVVTERNLHPGALVGPATNAGSTPILKLANVDRLRLTLAVPQDAIGAAKVGRAVDFTVASRPGQKFTAQIARTSGALDPRSRALMVELDTDNRGQPFAAGEFASVTWPVTRGEPALLVPTTAIATDQQRQFVIRVAGGKAQWVDVKTGRSKDNRIEVFGDLREGETVVLRATDAIKPDQPLTIQTRK
jgi:RND family efflux transporter MFP subunit